MTPRALRVLLAPEHKDDEVVVSRKKVAELQRRSDELDQTRRELEWAREEIRRLREKLALVENFLPVVGADGRTAAAAGVPTSKTYYPRPRPSPEERRKSGGQPGHPGVTRPRQVPNAPPRHLTLRACPKCGTVLGKPCDEWRRPLTDIALSHAETFDLVVHRYDCTGCGERVHAPLPVGDGEEFGPNVRALAVTLRAHGMSLGKVRDFFLSIGLKLVLVTRFGTSRVFSEEAADSFPDSGPPNRRAPKRWALPPRYQWAGERPR